jgi:hypothetical protein
VAALLETGLLFQDGQVTSRASRLTHNSEFFGSLPSWNLYVTQFNPKLPFAKFQVLLATALHFNPPFISPRSFVKPE